jgi:hypothetical protein
VISRCERGRATSPFNTMLTDITDDELIVQGKDRPVRKSKQITKSISDSTSHAPHTIAQKLQLKESPVVRRQAKSVGSRVFDTEAAVKCPHEILVWNI